MVVKFLFFLAAILALGIASMAESRCSGWTSPTPSQFNDCVSPTKLKNMSQLCGEILCVRFVGHVSSEEYMSG